MCRLMALYSDEPMLLARAIYWPDRSIIRQSYDARERLLDPSLPAHLGHGNLNADGFGIGWYSPPVACEAACTRNKLETPCTFKSITPAWNNDNLMRLSSKIVSSLIFAHVRAAYPGMPVSEQNCHPFAHNHYLFMHNGIIAGFNVIRRKLLEGLSDAAYDAVASFHSDSAVSFALFLSFLPNMHDHFGADLLLRAMQRVVQFISETQVRAGITADTSLLNFVVTDGSTMVATRFVSPDSDNPASLYYAEGTTFRRADGSDEQGEAPYTLEYADKGSRVVIVASEPITGAASEWVAVPRNHALVITRDDDGWINVLHTPIFAQEAGSRLEEVVSCLRALPHNTKLQMKRGASAQQLSALAAPLMPGARSFSACPTCGCGQAPPAFSQLQSILAHHAPDLLPGPPPMPSRSTCLSPRKNNTNNQSSRRQSLSHLRDPARADSTEPVPVTRSYSSHSAFAITEMAQSLHNMSLKTQAPALMPLEEIGDEANILTGHSAAVLCMVSDKQGRLYTSSADKTIKIWDLDHQHEVATLVGHSKPVLKLQLRGDRLFSIAGSSVRIWDCVTRCCIDRILTSRSAGTLRALCAPATKRIFVGCQDTTLKAYDVCVPGSQSQRQTQSSLMGAVKDTHTSPNVELHTVASVSGNGSSAMRAARATFDMSNDNSEVQTPTLAGRIDQGHCAAIHSVVCSERYLCSASGDSTIRAWRLHDMEPVGVLRGHRGPVFTLVVIGDLLLSGGRDCLIRVWDLDTLCCRRTLSGHSGDVLHLAALGQGLTENGNIALRTPSASGSPSPAPGSLSALVLSEEDESRSPFVEELSLSAADLSPVLIASCSADGTCRLWDARRWICLQMFTPNQPDVLRRPILCAALVGKQLALGTASGSIYTYDLTYLLTAADCVPLHPCSSTHEELPCTEEEGSDTDSAGRVESPSRGTSCSDRIPSCSDRMPSSQASKHNGKASAVTWRRPFQIKENVQARMDAQLLHCLRQFVAIPTVSSDAALKEQCFRGAKYLVHLLESVGALVKLVSNDLTAHPVVLARLEVCPKLPTVVFYGHYDVQPAREPDWNTDPFHVASKDGYLYGRGTSDNKGPILSMLFAVKELLDRREGEACPLPVNLAFVFEGDEEIGSRGLSAVVEDNLAWFADTELIVISNSQWLGDTQPCITYGMRGMICVTVAVEGGTRDLHSGNEGGVFNEPMNDLCRLLSTLVDSHHNILVPGFYDDVDSSLLQPTLDVIRADPSLHDFDASQYLDMLSVPALTCGNSLEEVLTSRWCLPTLSIADVTLRNNAANAAAQAQGPQSFSRFGPTRFSVVPKCAQGALSIRFVPDQSAGQLVTHLTRHLQHEFRKLRSSNRLDVKVINQGQWWSADPDGPSVQRAAQAVAAEWDSKPLPVREGGTMPCASLLEGLLGAPAIMVPMGQNSDNCHLSNERISRRNLIKGKNVMRRIIESFSVSTPCTKVAQPL